MTETGARPTFLQRIFKFSGRSNRHELLVVQIVSLAAVVLASFGSEYLSGPIRILLLSTVFVAALTSNASVAARRFHDLNMSGWYVVLALVPILNLYFGIYLLWLKQGDPQPNSYGPPV